MKTDSPLPVTDLPLDAVVNLLQKPLLDLVFEAAAVHREYHDSSRIQCSQLANIKSGGCPEDCKYCSQSAHYETPSDRSPMLSVDEVRTQAKQARENGADRFCMGAAWREVRDGEEFDRVLEMVHAVRAEGLESCATLGMLTETQASRLKEAGLDYYNHNLDTGRSHYEKIISTRTLDDRLQTVNAVRKAGIAVCCGGILGLGESETARAELIHQLAVLDPQPESVPINALVHVEGTPLQDCPPLDWTDLVRTIAATRILMPRSVIRLSAGRTEMKEESQAMCFLAGANSIFVGDELLTTPNPDHESDAALLAKLGLRAVGKES